MLTQYFKDIAQMPIFTDVDINSNIILPSKKISNKGQNNLNHNTKSRLDLAYIISLFE